MDYRVLKDIETGDTLLFSGNSAISTFLKIFTTSKWNHVGIAVRVLNDKITTKEGDLYVMEITPSERLNHLDGKYTKGVSIIPITSSLFRYNSIKVRKIRKVNKDICNLIYEFAQKYKDCEFNNSIARSLRVWVGMNSSEGNGSAFCSELVYKFYVDYYDSNNILPTNRDESTIRPCDFELDGCRIYKNKSVVLYNVSVDPIYLIIQPLLIILVIIIVVLGIFFGFIISSKRNGEV